MSVEDGWASHLSMGEGIRLAMDGRLCASAAETAETT
jgi:hypothetical protein